MNDALTAYIRGLANASAKSAAIAQSEEERKHQEEAEQFAQRAVPLPTRLKAIIAAMPETERNKPRPLEFFAERLRGRQRLSPHRGELAAALRSIGWTRRRNWRKSDVGNCSYWHPPVND
ncbi:MAG: hypothetical protein M0Z73_05240 [Betaproteobacteria bacterium]|nr:hypothetical protein [Betaproteobacteria bacterium]